MKNSILFVFTIFIGISLQAEELQKEFLPDSWSQGLHIFAGAGINTSSYKSTEQDVDFALGFNLKSDVGWYLNDRWAIESSASVKFNKIESDLIWDTLLTMGVRYRTNQRGNYARLFIGTAQTVLYPSGSRPELEGSASRYYFMGEAVGASVGRLYRSKNENTWFVEFSVTMQAIKSRKGVELDGEAPIVVSSTNMANNSTIHSIYITTGILLF